MAKVKDVYSPYISNSIVKRRSNILFEKIIRFFFRRLDFDSESKALLNEYKDKGKIVYVSVQSTNSSLIIFVNLLRRCEFNIPNLALDFSPFALQIFTNFLRRIFRFIPKIFSRKKYNYINDVDHIEEVLRDNKSIIFSLFSRKFFLKRYMDINYDNLLYLIDIQKKMEDPIFFFPQILFWNRNPERTKAIMTSKPTGDRGIFNAIFTIFKSATPAFVRVAPPVNLKEEIANSSSDDNKQIARKIRNKFLEIYNYEKRSILGPVIKSQSEMMEKVLYHKNVLDAIKEVNENDKTSEKKLRRKAYKYYREIAADFSIIYIRFFERSLDYVFSKIFDGIYYDLNDFKMLREASQKGPMILMPSHKSHMDYLILSSLFYQNKLIPPHIVAGSNLTFFPMGKIFRRSGAFFMRRSFRGLTLYTAVFKQYIKTLINEGYSIEFFIEGGRTRTGRLVTPKMGILNYLIESIEEGYNKDMVFIPTAINYDRILEESSYKEELGGKEKKTESTSNFVKSRKLLKRKYGRVYLSFNEPLSYQELKQQYAGTEDLTTDIGNLVIKKINDIIMVTPFALTSTAILLSTGKGFSKDNIKELILKLHNYLVFSNVNMSDTLQTEENVDQIIDYVIESFSEDNILTELQIDDGSDGSAQSEYKDLYVINEEERMRINFYRNNMIHYLLPISFVSVQLVRMLARDDIKIESIKKGYNEVREALSEEFIYPDIMEDVELVVNTALQFLEKESVVIRNGDSIKINEERSDELMMFARILEDFLESYLIVLDSVLKLKKSQNRKDLIMDIRKNGIKMYHLGEVRLSESLSISNYHSALDKLVGTGILTEEKISRKNIKVDLVDDKWAKHLKVIIQEYLSMLK